MKHWVEVAQERSEPLKDDMYSGTRVKSHSMLGFDMELRKFSISTVCIQLMKDELFVLRIVLQLYGT